MAEAQVDPQQMAFTAEKLREQLELASNHLERLTVSRQEKNQALRALQGVKEASVGDEILLPVGGTTFINAKLGENEQVVMGIGADYAMPRGVDEAIVELERDVEKLGGEIETLSAQTGRLETEYTSLVQQLQTMQGQGPQG